MARFERGRIWLKPVTFPIRFEILKIPLTPERFLGIMQHMEKSFEEAAIEREIGNLEAQIVGLRRALSLIQKRSSMSSSLAHSPSAPIRQPEPNSEVKIRSGTKRDKVREVLSSVGERFTPSDIDRALVAKGYSLKRVEITTILSRLSDRHEIFIQRNGLGGVEPIYTKSKKEQI